MTSDIAAEVAAERERLGKMWPNGQPPGAVRQTIKIVLDTTMLPTRYEFLTAAALALNGIAAIDRQAGEGE